MLYYLALQCGIEDSELPGLTERNPRVYSSLSCSRGSGLDHTEPLALSLVVL